jgi:hypothetical protein
MIKTPQLPKVPRRLTDKSLDKAREETLAFLDFASRSYDPDQAKKEITRGAKRLSQLVFASYRMERRYLARTHQL